MARSKEWLIVTMQLKPCLEELHSTDGETGFLSLFFCLLGFHLVWEKQARLTNLCTCSCGFSQTWQKGLPGSSEAAPIDISAPRWTLLLAGTIWFHWTAALLGWQNELKIAGGSHSFHIRSSWMQSDFNFFFFLLFFSFLSCFCPLHQYLKTTQWDCQLLLCFTFGLPFHLPYPCLWWWPVNH